MNSTFDIENIEGNIEEALLNVGIIWNVLRQSAQEIVLFGSRASKINKPDSDWDILCVGSGKSIYKKKINLIWIDKEELKSPRWLGSELASHIAKYGVWIKGAGMWKNSVYISSSAINKKIKRIIQLLRSLEHYWQYLSDFHKKKYLTKLRRDFQRLKILISRQPIPPSPTLDKIWHNNADLK